MAWLDDRLRDHPKIVRASAPAFKVWALALCYCSAHGTGGRLDEAVKALAVPRKVTEELVALKLWDREDDGLWVHDWQEHNSKRDADLDERRKAARDRQRRHRAKLRGQDPDAEVTRDSDVTSHAENVTASRVTDPRAGARPRHARDHDHDQGSDKPPAAAHVQDAAAAERLAAIGLDRSQFGALADDLLTAWLDLAETEAKTNPAAFVLTGVRTGQFPSPRIAAANGTDYVAKARALYDRTHDTEAVADWLAGLTISIAERERILEEATT